MFNKFQIYEIIKNRNTHDKSILEYINEQNKEIKNLLKQYGVKEQCEQIALQIGDKYAVSSKILIKRITYLITINLLDSDYKLTEKGTIYLNLLQCAVYFPDTYLNFQLFLKLEQKIRCNKENIYTKLIISLKRQNLLFIVKKRGNANIVFEFTNELKKYQSLLRSMITDYETIDFRSEHEILFQMCSEIASKNTFVCFNATKIIQETFITKNEAKTIISFLIDQNLASKMDKNNYVFNFKEFYKTE